MAIERLQYWTPWSLPDPWRARTFAGCDEWHNLSRVVGLPFLGAVVFFHGRFDRSGERHIHYRGPDGWEGRFDPACVVCREIYDDLSPDEVSDLPNPDR